VRGLFAQRRNLLRPRMWRMIADILRFYREAKLGGYPTEVTLGQYLDERGYGKSFVDDHLLPMGGAIWSTSPKQMLDHPLSAFVRFCDNHGLLQLFDRPVWRTVCGGSRSYVQRLLQDHPLHVVLNASIERVERAASGPSLVFSGGTRQRFDDVVIAAHADQALGLLAQPTEREKSLLSAMRYISNEAVLHSDTRMMPRRRAAWSSWNVFGGDPTSDQALICVTYWMNQLQNLAVEQPVLVTLNPDRAIREELVWRRFSYTHPLFDAASVAAQRQLWSLQGQGGIWYCGAYFGAGFHEDGLQAGLAVAEKLGEVRRPWQVSEPTGRIHIPEALDLPLPEHAAVAGAWT
jgi:predicted NAD/FAD-binding protein